MARKTILLKVDAPDQEPLIRTYHALVIELNDLALPAPDAAVIDQLEEHAIQRGRQTLRASLEQTVQKRIDEAEQKGRRSATALAATTNGNLRFPTRTMPR